MSIFPQDRTKKLLFLFSIFLFIKPLSTLYYAGWDTFDLNTVYFLFVSDIFNSQGELPMWNPLVLSGNPILPNLFHSSIFAPIDLFFLLLSRLVNPIYLSQLLTFLPLLVFIFTTYEIARYFHEHRRDVILASLLATTLLLPPIYGQVVFMYSLSFMSTIFLFILRMGYKNSLQKDYTNSQTFVRSFFLAALFAKGYFYLNLCILIFAGVLFICLYRSKDKVTSMSYIKVLPLFVTPCLLYLVLHGEALMVWINAYADLSGDLIIQEPRMRPLNVSERVGYSSFSHFLYAFFIRDKTWSLGFCYWGWFLPLAFFGMSKLRRPPVSLAVPLVFMSLWGILFSITNPFFDEIIMKIPLLGGNRWAVINIYFIIFPAAMILPYAFWFTRKLKKYHRKLIYRGLTLLIVCTGFYVIKNSRLSYTRVEPKHTLLKSRKRSFSPQYLTKKLGEEKEFQIDDKSWLTEKSMITHGYDNTVNEFYWRQKDMAFNRFLVHFPVTVSSFSNSKREMFSTDNSYVEHLVKRIESSEHKFFADENINVVSSMKKNHVTVEIKPNSLEMRVFNQSNKEAFLVLTQSFHPGWKAYVDGQMTKIFRINKSFMGIKISEEGEHAVLFKYQPLTLWLLILFYLGILFLYVYLLAREHLNKKLTSSF